MVMLSEAHVPGSHFHEWEMLTRADGWVRGPNGNHMVVQYHCSEGAGFELWEHTGRLPFLCWVSDVISLGLHTFGYFHLHNDFSLTPKQLL